MASKSDPTERKVVPKGVPNHQKSAKNMQKCNKNDVTENLMAEPRPGGLREAVSEPRPGGLREALTINNHSKQGLRRGPMDHSFNLPYSLELIFDFWEKSLLGCSRHLSDT